MFGVTNGPVGLTNRAWRVMRACALPVALFCVASSGGCQEGIDPAVPRVPEGGLPDAGAGLGDGGCEPFLPAFLVGSFMATGLPCLDCHGGASADGRQLFAAGTVFDTSTREDRCQGVSDVEVVLTEADGTDHRAVSNFAGNFYFDAPLDFPLRARVQVDGLVLPMSGDVEHGNCNACHTAEGEMGAPGRIVSPTSN